MPRFKVTPTDKNGNLAPYYIIDIGAEVKNPETQAINEAKSLSRLSSFGWDFNCNQILKK